MPDTTILIAEDDAAIRELLHHNFEREGYRVIAVADGFAALRTARSVASIAILDVGLPGLDGFEVARSLRRDGNDIPILILSARSDEVDRVVGFEVGADDYVVKPFSPHEVLARVKAILRRSGRGPDLVPVALRFGRVEIDEVAREARVDGARVHLKPREFALLLELGKNPGVAYSRDKLLERVWGYEYAGDPRTVDVHIHRIRERIELPFDLSLVQTVHGYGYKIAKT